MDPKIGELIPRSFCPQRDAIHIAVHPAVAGESLLPGARVGISSFDDRGLAICLKLGAYSDVRLVGVVDPFLAAPVLASDKFWLFLWPGTVTGMRHHWQHPAFVAEGGRVDGKAEATAWLNDFAEEYGLDFNEMISECDASGHQGYISFSNGDAAASALRSDSSLGREFWAQYCIFSGTKRDETPEYQCHC